MQSVRETYSCNLTLLHHQIMHADYSATFTHSDTSTVILRSEYQLITILHDMTSVAGESKERILENKMPRPF